MYPTDKLKDKESLFGMNRHDPFKDPFRGPGQKGKEERAKESSRNDSRKIIVIILEGGREGERDDSW